MDIFAHSVQEIYILSNNFHGNEIHFYLSIVKMFNVLFSIEVSSLELTLLVSNSLIV